MYRIGQGFIDSNKFLAYLTVIFFLMGDIHRVQDKITHKKRTATTIAHYCIDRSYCIAVPLYNLI